MTPPTITFSEFARQYCERQEQTPDGLQAILKKQVERYHPVGFMLLECQQMDSYRCGSLVILPYGPENTFKEPPTHPISPRGIASDMSIVIALCRADSV